MQYTACVKTLSPSGRLKTAFCLSNSVFKALESHEKLLPMVLFKTPDGSGSTEHREKQQLRQPNAGHSAAEVAAFDFICYI
jgi:hypothetical protein